MQMRTALRRFFLAGAPQDTHSGGWSAPVARRMLVAGFLVRVLYLTLAHTYRFRLTTDHFQYGWEMGRIARALATGHGYSDPFDGHTGPTAWTPPLYPLLMAGLFKLFGVYSNLSAWCLLTVNSLFSAATAPAIVEVANRTFGRRAAQDPAARNVALWSGWLWALYPAAMQYAVRWPWDMAITACLFTWAIALGFRLRAGFADGHHELPTTLNFALLWAAVALLNSSLLIFLPAQAIWILWPARTRPHAWAAPALAASVLFLLCLAPWVLRNQRALHAFVPLRANFGVELYNAALPSHNGFPWGTAVPIGVNSPELNRYARLGEVAYSRDLAQKGKALIAADPARYLRETLLRIQFYWVSVPHPLDHGLLDEAVREANYAFLSVSGLLGLALALHRRVFGAGLFAAAFLLLPLVYYLVTVQARFRHPMEPLITILSVYLFTSADRHHLWSWNQKSSHLPTTEVPLA